ncbi:class I SAM-dependent methyltransferase [Paenibacillus elgii]
MSFHANVQEKVLFLNKFIQSPKQMGSITPSSRFLARAMTKPVPWAQAQVIAELGAGTGALTRFIRQAKGPKTKVLLFEKEQLLREQLKAQFPEFSCHADACSMGQVLNQQRIEGLDAIISGLPFYNFPQQLRDRLIEQITSSLKPGGRFIAFQYSLQMKSQLEQDFDIETIRFVPFNFPPAFVYVCRKPGGTAQ